MKQQSYLGLMDMIDGGGAGRSGSEFQGGGVLSALANAFAQPYGSQERQEQMQQARPMARPGQPIMQPPMPQRAPAQPMQAPVPVQASTLPPQSAPQPTQNPHPPMLPPVQGPQMPMRPQARPPMQGPQMAQEPQVQSEAFADWVVGTYGRSMADSAAEDREVLGQLIREYLKDK